jgi:REP element-mobilizing transposase RayT
MNTYSNIYLHIVFSVKYRDGAIGEHWMPELHAYIASVFKANGHHPIIIGGVDDHVHCLVGYNMNQSVPDMVREVKTSATAWINAGHRTLCKFAWQKGYGVFSYSKSHVEAVKQYIANQAAHHKKETFRDEFVNLLKNRGIYYDEKYLPQDLE